MGKDPTIRLETKSIEQLKEPKPRYGTKKAIDELVAQYVYRYDSSMQDWPIEIADSNEIKTYFLHYDEQIDADKKFSLMEMLIQALTNVKNEQDFDRYWIELKTRLVKNFEIHEYTIFDWSCSGEEISLCWKITPNMRELWNDIKGNTMFDIFGNKVRIISSPETKLKGLDGKEGIIYGQTTPSTKCIKIIGELNEDVAFNIHFDDLNESFWFAEQLIQHLDDGEGTEMTLDGVNLKWTKAAKGKWVEEKTDNKKWWQFWK